MLQSRTKIWDLCSKFPERPTADTIKRMFGAIYPLIEGHKVHDIKSNNILNEDEQDETGSEDIYEVN